MKRLTIGYVVTLADRPAGWSKTGGFHFASRRHPAHLFLTKEQALRAIRDDLKRGGFADVRLDTVRVVA